MKIACLIIFLFGAFSLRAQLNYSIIPLPKEILAGKGKFQLNEQTVFVCSDLCTPEVNLFLEWLNQATQTHFTLGEMSEMPSENFVLFSCARSFEKPGKVEMPKLPGNLNAEMENIDPGGYKLIINEKSMMISAQYTAGIFYATQTLKQLFPIEAEIGKLSLPTEFKSVLIKDESKFMHRGLLLDCCRHFMSKDFIKRYIDHLARYKMNVLHWHLTDDQGWRIQIDRYPELTNTGAWRTESDGTRYGGFYSKEDIREIVRYADARHITIIPEIEMPGHAVAAIASYPSLSCTGENIAVENEWGVFKDIFCAGNDSTFIFLENVLNEVCELFPSPYFHIGGDEAPKIRWSQCHKCQKRISDEGLKSEAELQTYFIERIAEILNRKGKKIIGWDEILEGGIPGNAIVQCWRSTDAGVTAVRQNHGVIMSPTSHCYFDYGLSAIDLKKVYSFYPIPDGLNLFEQSFIRGGECNMWSEHAPQETIDSKIFPRILAMSEVLWSYPEQRNFQLFYSRVEEHYQRLSCMQVDFGFPFVPVKMSSKCLKDGEMQIELSKEFKQAGVSYYFQNTDVSEEHKSRKEVDSTTVLYIHKPTTIIADAVFNGKNYPEEISCAFDPHAAAGKAIKLSYTPSEYYLGGGLNALADGILGSSNFRDGKWQAVQGQDMEAVIDLGEEKKLGSISTHWFHYTNAWIFRPSAIEYWLSKDNVHWTAIDLVSVQIPEDQTGELIMNHSCAFKKQSARYVKMLAHNNGPCPNWHDAASEPSWLFCDEIIVH